MHDPGFFPPLLPAPKLTSIHMFTSVCSVSSKPGSPKPSPQIGDEDVQCAADLASYFSKGRNDLKCDVIVAKAGGLKKPKGGKPGQVCDPVFEEITFDCKKLMP